MSEIKECKYTYKLNPKDLWKYNLVMTYSSLAGIVQIVFTISMIVLLITKWPTAGPLFISINIFACLIFPVFQPIAMLGKAYNDFTVMPENTISFDDKAMYVQVGDHIQSFTYYTIKAVANKPGMILVQPDDIHVYIIPGRVLGDDKKVLAEFLKEQIKKKGA